MNTVGKKPIIFVAEIYHPHREPVEAALIENGITKDKDFPNVGNFLVIFPKLKKYAWNYGFKWTNLTRQQIISGEIFETLKEYESGTSSDTSNA